MTESVEERAQIIIDQADRERKLHVINGLKKYDKPAFNELMQKVELYPKFLTPEQVSAAKELILDGLASDAEEAYQIMRDRGNITNDAWSSKK